MNVRNDLIRIIDDLLGDDPRLALIACARLTNDEIPWLEQRAVSLARRNGWNWAKIGRLLRRTRQSARQRFDNATLAMRPDPHLLRHRQEAEFAGIREANRQAAAMGAPPGTETATIRSPGDAIHRSTLTTLPPA